MDNIPLWQMKNPNLTCLCRTIFQPNQAHLKLLKVSDSQVLDRPGETMDRQICSFVYEFSEDVVPLVLNRCRNKKICKVFTCKKKVQHATQTFGKQKALGHKLNPAQGPATHSSSGPEKMTQHLSSIM